MKHDSTNSIFDNFGFLVVSYKLRFCKDEIIVFNFVFCILSIGGLAALKINCKTKNVQKLNTKQLNHELNPEFPIIKRSDTSHYS